jgi:hypothetical protein
LVPQDPCVRASQDGSRQDAKLVIEPAPGLLVDFQRGGLLTAAGQGNHQAREGALVQRVTAA